MACAGIDFGNKTSVVAIARRGGIDVCTNEVSNRATPSIVSFQGEERHIGEAAASIAAQNHRNTVSSLQRLLGVPRRSAFANEEASRLTCGIVSYPSTSTSAATVSYAGANVDGEDNESAVFSFEALTAMLLSNLMNTASVEYKAPVRDLVVSVPVYYTHSQRQAILHAATIANLNVLRVLNEHAAIALSYGIFRTKELPETTPIKVAFVDVGEASSTVSITAFTNTRCEVISVASDPSLGGRNLDDIIVNRFAEQFKKNYSIDVLSKPKPAARLRKEAEKVKRILSTNPKAMLNIESLMNDTDVKGQIERDELEDIATPLTDRLRELCKKAILEANLKDGEGLTAVEIVGGGTRVPSVKKAIADVFGSLGAPLRTTLNADESIARGCALMSAMLSPAFKVRDYALTDIASHALDVDKVFTDGTPTESLLLVPKGNAVPCVKIMKFRSPGALTVNVRYDDASTLPAGIDHPLICGYLIQAPIDPEAKVHVKVRLTSNSIVELSSAQLVKEEEVEEEVIVKQAEKPSSTPEANGTAEGDSTMSEVNTSGSAPNAPVTNQSDISKGTENESSSNGETDKKDDKMETEKATASNVEQKEPVITEKRMVKKKKITDLVTTPLDVGGFNLTQETVLLATEKEAKMKAHDLYIKERSEAMNSLEAYVYDLRSRIDEYGGDLKEYSSNDFRDSLRKELDDTEEWIYSEEAEKASKSMFTEKKNILMQRASPMLMRKKENDERPVRVKVFEAKLDNFKHVAVSPSEDYAHIKQEDKDKLLKCVEDASIWLKNERTKQDTVPKDQDPLFTCEMLMKKQKEVESVCDPIRNTPKPPPKKEDTDKMETDAEIKPEEGKEAGTADANGEKAGKEEAKVEGDAEMKE